MKCRAVAPAGSSPAMITPAPSCFTVPVLLPLRDDGAPVHAPAMAADLTELGATVMACTPDRFPDILAAALQ